MTKSSKRKGKRRIREIKELPEDVITDILICLPVKSLLRFRSVSKRFLALIDSPVFIQRHLNRSLLTKTNYHKLILRGEEFMASPSTTCLYSVELYELDQALELDQPCGIQIFGSVNGLLCLCGGKDDIVIWNFATRNYYKLPVFEFGHGSGLPYDFSYGFGYDSVSDDYKLLIVVLDLVKVDESLNSEAKIYSMRSNSWQRIQDFPFYFCSGERYGQLVAGALHWVVFLKHGSAVTFSIAVFDLATNEYRLIEHPEFLKKGSFNLTKLEGRLCVLCFFCDRVDVWVMKNYGVVESWSKLFSVSRSEGIRSFELLVPLAYSKSGTEIMLFQANSELLWYSLREGTMRRTYLFGCPYDLILPEICVESLVPLRGKAEDYSHKKKGKGGQKEIKVTKKRCWYANVSDHQELGLTFDVLCFLGIIVLSRL